LPGDFDGELDPVPEPEPELELEVLLAPALVPLDVEAGLAGEPPDDGVPDSFVVVLALSDPPAESALAAFLYDSLR
jgi:hypothetical protein